MTSYVGLLATDWSADALMEKSNFVIVVLQDRSSRRLRLRSRDVDCTPTWSTRRRRRRRRRKRRKKRRRRRRAACCCSGRGRLRPKMRPLSRRPLTAGRSSRPPSLNSSRTSLPVSATWNIRNAERGAFPLSESPCEIDLTGSCRNSHKYCAFGFNFHSMLVLFSGPGAEA